MGEVAVIVLAAGEGRRMGGRPKASLRLPATEGRPGETFLERIVATARAAGCAPVVVVRGEADLPAPEGADVRVVRNPRPELGMLSSIHVGIEALRGGGGGGGRVAVAGALVWPVDCPRVPVSAVRALLDAAARGAPMAVPVHGGRRGHPAYFAGRLFPELLAAPMDVGARAVVRAHAADLALVPVEGPEVLDDIDTPEDYERLGLVKE